MTANATTMGTYLKMPMAGFRRYSNADVSDVGTNGFYWSSTPSDSYSNSAYSLHFHPSSIAQSHVYRSYAHSVRCFKDTPIVPTSSWTTLYDGSSVVSGA